MKKINLDAYEIAMLALMTGLIGLSVHKCVKGHPQPEKVEVVTVDKRHDSLKVWKDKDSLSNAMITALETEKARNFLKLNVLSNENLRLQKEVEKYQKELKNGGALVNVSNEVKVETTTATKVDTINHYPVYSSNYNLNDWVVGEISANKDSIRHTLSVRNEYTVILSKQKSGFLGLGPTYTNAHVVNHNPYSQVRSMRALHVQENKPKRFGFGPYVGVGVDTNFKIKPIFGVGIGYNLINF